MLNQNIIVYTILLVVFIFIFKLESTDIHCPKLRGSTAKECEEQGGMSYSGTRPNDTDSCKTLIDKIYKGAGAEQASIKWRRSFILSAIIVFCVWVFLGSKVEKFDFLPDWKTFILSLLICYVVLLAGFMYYSFHVFGVAESWMKGAINELKAKGCIKE